MWAKIDMCLYDMKKDLTYFAMSLYCSGPGDSSSQLLILVCAPIGGILVACILLSLCLVCFKFKTSKKGAM